MIGHFQIAHEMCIDLKQCFTLPDQHCVRRSSKTLRQRGKRDRFENGSFTHSVRADEDINFRRKIAYNRIRMIAEIAKMNGFGAHAIILILKSGYVIPAKAGIQTLS